LGKGDAHSGLVKGLMQAQLEFPDDGQLLAGLSLGAQSQ
jgi:hypothetical protein